MITAKEQSQNEFVTTLNMLPVPRIEFRDISLAFDTEVVLDHVSFKVSHGEMKVLLGESGGGKSTIIKLVPGLLLPDGGETFVDGEEITRLPEEELKCRNQITAHLPSLPATLTVRAQKRLDRMAIPGRRNLFQTGGAGVAQCKAVIHSARLSADMIAARAGYQYLREVGFQQAKNSHRRCAINAIRQACSAL